jgi:hypothetical protein
MFLIDRLPKNMKSYLQIESDDTDRISEKYFIEPKEFFLKRKNKKRINIDSTEDVSFLYRNKIGAFKMALQAGNGEPLNHLTPMINIKNVKYDLIPHADNIIVLTNQKFHKKWKYKVSVNAPNPELKTGIYPNTLPKFISLVDSSSYRLHSNKTNKFILTEKSKLKTYVYNVLLPGIAGFTAGDNGPFEDAKKMDEKGRFLKNKNLISSLTISSYLLMGVSFLDNMSKYNKAKDNYFLNMELYNTTGNGKYKDLTLEYYSDATKSEENMYTYGILTLAINILSNYYISNSKWFTWK